MLRLSNLNEYLDNTVCKFERDMTEFERKRCSWLLNLINRFEFLINRCNP